MVTMGLPVSFQPSYGQLRLRDLKALTLTVQLRRGSMMVTSAAEPTLLLKPPDPPGTTPNGSVQ